MQSAGADRRPSRIKIVSGGVGEYSAMMTAALVAFDLDGTILRGPTVCELLARPLGRLAEMKRFEALASEAELMAARHEMAEWYGERDQSELERYLEDAVWAPGARDAVAMLQGNGCEVVLASITWKFAVAWFGKQIGITEVLGTSLGGDGAIGHVWGRDKAAWLRRLAGSRLIPTARLAAVGDSAGDTELLKAAGIRVFVGASAPAMPALIHLPEADLRAVAETILSRLGDAEQAEAES